MSLSLALAVAIGVTSTDYDCVTNRTLTTNGHSVLLRDVGQTRFEWAFHLKLIAANEEYQIDVDWPGDPLRPQGRHHAVPTGDGITTYVFSTPYNDYEDGAETSLWLSPIKDGSADLLILPRSFATNRFHDPYTGPIEGKCKAREMAG